MSLYRVGIEDGSYIQRESEDSCCTSIQRNGSFLAYCVQHNLHDELSLIDDGNHTQVHSGEYEIASFGISRTAKKYRHCDHQRRRVELRGSFFPSLDLKVQSSFQITILPLPPSKYPRLALSRRPRQMGTHLTALYTFLPNTKPNMDPSIPLSSHTEGHTIV